MKIFTLCSEFSWPLGIPLLQKIGYFMSYQRLLFQFTLIARDQVKQRNYVWGRTRFYITCEQILVRILQFICQQHVVRLVSMVCLEQNSIKIVSFVS